MSRATTPEKIVSEAVINVLRGMRLSDNPKVASLAAARENEEVEYFKALGRKRRTRVAGKGSRR